MSGAKVDVRGILERAGANPDSPEGSQAWALAQVDAAVVELVKLEVTLSKVVSLAHVGKARSPRWSHVSKVTSHGSGVSMSLCAHFDLDPHEIVGKTDPVKWAWVANIGPQS